MLNLKCWWQSRLADAEHIAESMWQELIARVTLIARYPVAERDRLRELTLLFLHQKAFHGAGGLELTEHMRLMIAAQACVPILKLGIAWYRGWVSVIVYPDAFLAPHQYMDEAGVVHDCARPLSGESWGRGPVVLSWRDVEEDARRRDRGNVVIHEFAHKLDLLNGTANGMPPLHRNMERTVWTDTFARAFQDFCARVEWGETLPLDAYAAENPGEFFAVMSEAFFIHPKVLRTFYPQVYRQMSAFYLQDPGST